MTLIAALHTDSCPILLGDIMISSTIPPTISITLPTQRKIPAGYSPDGEHYVRNFYQKIHIFDSTLAVAWSGSYIHARGIFREIRDLLAERHLMHESVADYFSNRPVDEKVSLIGLHRDSRSDTVMTFHRNCHHHNSEEYGPCILSGTGAGYLFPYFFQRRQSTINRVSGDNAGVLHEALGSAIAFSSHVVREEIETASNLEFLFGGGMEYCAFVGRHGIRKLSNITYVFWDFRLSSKGDFEMVLLNTLTKTWYWNRLMLIKTALVGVDKTIRRFHGYIVNSILCDDFEYDLVSKDILKEAFDFSNEFLCSTIRLTIGDSEAISISLVEVFGRKKMPFEFVHRDGKVFVEFTDAYLSALRNVALRSLKRTT